MGFICLPIFESSEGVGGELFSSRTIGEGYFFAEVESERMLAGWGEVAFWEGVVDVEVAGAGSGDVTEDGLIDVGGYSERSVGCPTTQTNTCDQSISGDRASIHRYLVTVLSATSRNRPIEHQTQRFEHGEWSQPHTQVTGSEETNKQ